MLYWVIKHVAIRERGPGFPEGSGVEEHRDQGERGYKFHAKWSLFSRAEWEKGHADNQSKVSGGISDQKDTWGGHVKTNAGCKVTWDINLVLIAYSHICNAYG